MIQQVTPIEKEFLFKTVFQNEQPVRFHGISSACTGLITDIDRSRVSVTLNESIDNTMFSVCERITGYFDFHGNTYAFESTVRNSSDNRIQIDSPDKLIRSLQRKYVRIKKPKGVAVRFHLPNEEINLNYPVCPEYVSVEDATGDSEYVQKKLPDIIAEFREKISTKAFNNTIIMFRTKKPDMFEEELITKTGKVLFVPSTSSSLPKNDPYPEGRIITQDIEESFEDPNYFIEGTKFDKMLKEKKSRGIVSEIWCPIIYYQYVVGYIYAAASGMNPFDVSMIDYLWDFSRILAYKLKETGYFVKEAAEAPVIRHSAQILDMSPGGLLITLPSSEIRSPVKEGSIFAIDINLGNQTITCSAKVNRRYQQKDMVSYGLIFLDLSPENMMAVYEFLYRKPYTAHDPLAYEQNK